MRLAFFVTPHGFGHATRASALMQAIHDREPAARFDIVTTAPDWIFAESLTAPFRLTAVETDVGLVQRDALREDLAETVRRLDALVPPPPSRVDDLARRLTDRGACGVVCDIAPLGIAVARAAGIPSVLVENFTWDWIYEGYLAREPGLGRFLGPLRELFAAADVHVQAAPVCVPRDGARQVAPVGRRPRLPADEVRHQLGVESGQRLVLVTMGGVGFEGHDLGRLAGLDGVVVALAGTGGGLRREGSLRRFPVRSGFYHPDLVAASDVVVGKLGYSTVAEATLAGVPVISVARPAFRETSVLAEFVAAEVGGVVLDEGAFASGEWIERLPEMWSGQRRVDGGAADGAVEAARIVLEAVRRTEVASI